MYAKKICIVVVVVVILAIAIWGLNPRLMNGVPARVQLAQAAIGRNGPIAKALANYKLDMGNLPDTADGLRVLFRTKESNEKDLRYKGPYLDGKFDEFRDPWGEPFEYRSPGEMNVGEYDFWSRGPDKKNDEGKKGSDDIKNWKDN